VMDHVAEELRPDEFPVLAALIGSQYECPFASANPDRLCCHAEILAIVGIVQGRMSKRETDRARFERLYTA
jgi:hypothetical protein